MGGILFRWVDAMVRTVNVKEKEPEEEELSLKIDIYLKELEDLLESETKTNVFIAERETGHGDSMDFALSGSSWSSGTSFLTPLVETDVLKTFKWNASNVTELKELKSKMSVGSLIKF